MNHLTHPGWTPIALSICHPYNYPLDSATATVTATATKASYSSYGNGCCYYGYCEGSRDSEGIDALIERIRKAIHYPALSGLRKSGQDQVRLKA